MMPIRFLLNGEPVELATSEPTTTLLDWLRDTRGLTGTKEGCNEGDCGACTVTVTTLEDGTPVHRAVNSCILFLPQLHGKAVRTVEGIAPPGRLHPVQAAMIDHHGAQCGFCTPGIVMSLYTAHRTGARDYDDLLAGNLCRCTGYAPILRAAEAADPAPPPWERGEAEALAALASAGDDAIDGAFLPADLDRFAEWYAANPDAILVGGATDVGLWVTKGLRDLPKLAFLHRLRALGTVEETPSGLRLGAGVSMARLHTLMADRHPDFAEILRRFGSVQVRSAATLGGNIANGSPIGDSMPALIALGATLTLRRGPDRRDLPLEDFFLAYGRQDRRPGEFVESVLIPAQPDALRCGKISKRFDQDISAVLGCFNIRTENGTVTHARIGFGGMAPTPKRARATEAALLGRSWTEATVTDAGRALRDDFQPITDMRASAAYRLRTAENLLRRTHLETTGAARIRLVGRGAA